MCLADILIPVFDPRTTRTNTIFEEFLEVHKRRLLKNIICKTKALYQAKLGGKPFSKFESSYRVLTICYELCDGTLRLRI